MQTNLLTSNKRVLLLLIAVIVIFLGFVIYSISTVQTNSGRIAVQVDVVPQGATLTVNDKKTKTGTVYLEPGTYSATASKDGFETHTEDFQIDTDHTYILVALNGVSDEAKAYEALNRKTYTEYEAKVGEASRQSGVAFKEKFPIVRLLPVNKLVYKIGYTSSDEKSITLTIHAITVDQRRAAIQQIRDWGYDPTDYKINFTEFRNPLE